MIDINISKVCKSFGFDLVLNNIDITVQKEYYTKNNRRPRKYRFRFPFNKK